MADPLSLLREYTINKKKIVEREGQIIFGESSWPKDTKTNYLIWSSGVDGIPNEFYTLESLIFILENVSLCHPVYARRAHSNNIPVVRRPDRKDLLAYLNGDASCVLIDKNDPTEIPSEVIKSASCNKPKNLPKNSWNRKKPNLLETLDSSKKTYEIRSLEEAISAEKIAAIRAKRLAMKTS